MFLPDFFNNGPNFLRIPRVFDDFLYDRQDSRRVDLQGLGHRETGLVDLQQRELVEIVQDLGMDVEKFLKINDPKD